MKIFFLILGMLLLGAAAVGFRQTAGDNAAEVVRFSDTEAGFEEFVQATQSAEGEIPPDAASQADAADQLQIPQPAADLRFSRWGAYWREFSEEERKFYENWKRPPGPLRVGLQAGHWKNDEVPDELSGLKRSGGGAQGGGRSEWEVVLEIARQAKALLEAEGMVVDLLPATIPVDYVADAFVSVHADGNGNPSVSGFKIAGPRGDFSGRAPSLASALYESYERETGLKRDASVSRRMSGYYTFNWRRYDHALHPLTPAVIVETGFMTSPEDRAVIVDRPERAAKGIADGIAAFLSQD
ncbi:hypothetical protein C4587_02710 [Candidatus Parcubacteria bacterium]|nr:MAG: hypothetical protein C4587_02710 [Candidatus Parcubacteria bacterium]